MWHGRGACLIYLAFWHLQNTFWTKEEYWWWRARAYSMWFAHWCCWGLTMCYPAMFAVFTLSPPQLPRLEAVTVTVHQSAADSLLITVKKNLNNNNKPSSEFLKQWFWKKCCNCFHFSKCRGIILLGDYLWLD